MAVYKTKKLSKVQLETEFQSQSSNNIIVEDGGNIRRISKDNLGVLPKATIEDAGKILEIDEQGKYVLKNKEVPLNANLVIG